MRIKELLCGLLGIKYTVKCLCGKIHQIECGGLSYCIKCDRTINYNGDVIIGTLDDLEKGWFI